MGLGTKATAAQHSPLRKLCKCELQRLGCSLCDHTSLIPVCFRPSSIKEEQEDEEICENYPYESPESTDEQGHSPELNQDEGSPERPNLHFDRVPSL